MHLDELVVQVRDVQRGLELVLVVQVLVLQLEERREEIHSRKQQVVAQLLAGVVQLQAAKALSNNCSAKSEAAAAVHNLPSSGFARLTVTKWYEPL